MICSVTLYHMIKSNFPLNCMNRLKINCFILTNIKCVYNSKLASHMHFCSNFVNVFISKYLYMYIDGPLFIFIFFQTGADWQFQRVTIQNMTSVVNSYRIIIERIVQTVGSSDVAIDDISVQEGSCDSLPTIAPHQCAFTCPTNQKCQSRDKVSSLFQHQCHQFG